MRAARHLGWKDKVLAALERVAELWQRAFIVLVTIPALTHMLRTKEDVDAAEAHLFKSDAHLRRAIYRTARRLAGLPRIPCPIENFYRPPLKSPRHIKWLYLNHVHALSHARQLAIRMAHRWRRDNERRAADKLSDLRHPPTPAAATTTIVESFDKPRAGQLAKPGASILGARAPPLKPDCLLPTACDLGSVASGAAPPRQTPANTRFIPLTVRRKALAVSPDGFNMPHKHERESAMTGVAKVLGLSLLAAGLALPASAKPWSKSYLVEIYEYAHIYGRTDNAKDQPGTDCPKGTNPDVDWTKALLIGKRTPADVKKLLDPERRSAGGFDRSFYYNRGPNGENVYTNPTVIKDTGQKDVEGKVSLGFDLDNNPDTGDFTSPEGVKGIDNAFYKSSGCWPRFRGPERQVASYSNDGMHDGVYTIVLVVSGDKDPMNDDAAKLGVYLSQDKMVKDANGEIARDYSFRIDPQDAFQTVADVKINNGVIETKAPITLRMRDFYTPGFFPKELVLEKAQMRFEMKKDGSLYGIFGGYRDWMVHYIGTAGNGGWSAGSIHESVGHINLPIWWHALKRHADGMPDPKTGEMKGISTTYRIWAVPAFVTTPDGKQPVTQARRFEPEKLAEGGAPKASRSR